ncbi:site-specific integrase [Liquorilactobacillus mali]|uniref:site-specific integrase n=1 Tax=Liquorilactobacillus mali TaxID=1618 RepID=UPI00234FC80E|nr:site-specific integrase [Liquorilactobacillus mali]MDC7952294.1 site-specific integrase [Liquorilactobacillus mali]
MAENYYTKEELQKFLQCVYESSEYKVYTFFRLLAFSGMRKGEVLALTWSDVHLTDMTISITKTQSRGKDGINVQTAKTNESMRTVWLDKKTISILKEWKKEQRSWLLQGRL